MSQLQSCAEESGPSSCCFRRRSGDWSGRIEKWLAGKYWCVCTVYHWFHQNRCSVLPYAEISSLMFFLTLPFDYRTAVTNLDSAGRLPCTYIAPACMGFFMFFGFAFAFFSPCAELIKLQRISFIHPNCFGKGLRSHWEIGRVQVGLDSKRTWLRKNWTCAMVCGMSSLSCVGGTDPMNHKNASSLYILQMRDVCCQLGWFGYKFCHFSLKLKIAKMQDCVIKLMLSSRQTPVNRQAAQPSQPSASRTFCRMSGSGGGKGCGFR